MAIYHLHMKVIGRSSGGKCASRGRRLPLGLAAPGRADRSADMTSPPSAASFISRGVVAGGSPRGSVGSGTPLERGRGLRAPPRCAARPPSWNYALPREMTQAQAIELARDFVQSEFVDRGMIADLNVHWDRTDDGMPKPPCPCHADNAVGQARTALAPRVRDWKPHRSASNAGGNDGRASQMRDWPNSISTRGSTIAASRRRASRWTHRTRSARPRNGISGGRGPRGPTARDATRSIARENGPRIIRRTRASRLGAKSPSGTAGRTYHPPRDMAGLRASPITSERARAS